MVFSFSWDPNARGLFTTPSIHGLFMAYPNAPRREYLPTFPLECSHFSPFHVGKYSHPMEHLGCKWGWSDHYLRYLGAHPPSKVPTFDRIKKHLPSKSVSQRIVPWWFSNRVTKTKWIIFKVPVNSVQGVFCIWISLKITRNTYPK